MKIKNLVLSAFAVVAFVASVETATVHAATPAQPRVLCYNLYHVVKLCRAALNCYFVNNLPEGHAETRFNVIVDGKFYGNITTPFSLPRECKTGQILRIKLGRRTVNVRILP